MTQSQTTKTIELTIGHKTFELTIDPQDEKPLREAADIVTRNLEQCPHASPEMRALTVAFNLAYDYILLRTRSEQFAEEVKEHLAPLLAQSPQGEFSSGKNPDREATLHEALPANAHPHQKK